ncbi:MAG: UDP-N-acetylglucosamine 2-epimerase (non-hydrolyzing) [Patescibacteria group bacterium]
MAEHKSTRKVAVVFGTRPEAIKLVPVIRELQHHDRIKLFTCVFWQHKKMLQQVLGVFDIIPTHQIPFPLGDKGIWGSGGILKTVLNGPRLGYGLFKFFSFLRRERPDLLIVQGDTSTAFLAAFLAFHFRISIMHVEAGLRTFDKYAPFPEEINRRLISVLADIHCAPTDHARENLVREQVPESSIFVTGNTALDALRIILKSEKREDFRRWESLLLAKGQNLRGGKKLLLITAHRRESFGEGLENICGAIRQIATLRSDVIFLYPVHLNPNVQKVVREKLSGISNVILTEPLSYEIFSFLMDAAYLILTDSGGIQEEVSFLGKPILVLREKTERPEGITAGNAMLVGANKERIVREVLRLLDDTDQYRFFARKHTAFGDGHAAERIGVIIESFFGVE